MSLMKVLKKVDLELTLVAIPGLIYTTRFNDYLYLTLEIVPTNSFEQILSH